MGRDFLCELQAVSACNLCQEEQTGLQTLLAIQVAYMTNLRILSVAQNRLGPTSKPSVKVSCKYFLVFSQVCLW